MLGSTGPAVLAVPLGLKVNVLFPFAILGCVLTFTFTIGFPFWFWAHWSLHYIPSGPLFYSPASPHSWQSSVLEDPQCHAIVPTSSCHSCTICWPVSLSLGSLFTSVPDPGKKFLTVIVLPRAGKGASMTLLMRGCTRAGEMPRLFSTSSKIWNKDMKTQKHANQEESDNSRNEVHLQLSVSSP